MKKYYVFLLLTLLVSACGGDDELEQNRPNIGRDYINVTPNLQLLADGQVTELKIEANCNWTISVSEDWLTVTPLSGVNTQNVIVSAGKNSANTERTAVLTIRGGSAPERSVMVTQKAGEDTPPTEPTEPGPNDNNPPS